MTTQPDRQDGDGLRSAFQPFADFMAVEMFDKLSDESRLTAGSSIARRQLTIGDLRKLAIAVSAITSPTRDGAEGADWKDDPSADERWQAGLDFGMIQLCATLGVDPKAVTWDEATETLDGDVSAVIWNILRAKMGDDWDPHATQPKTAPDAMRLLPLDAETRRDLNVIFRSAVNQRLTGSGTWDDVIGDAINAIFKLAAPVPPADGALFECPGCGIEIGSQVHAATCSWQQNSAERFKASHQPRMSGERDPSVMPDCRSAETSDIQKACADLASDYWKTTDSKPIRKDYECLIGRKIAAAILEMPPSGTGAVEPVATPENAVYQKITGPGVDALENRKEQIAPPVRGDREAIADKAMHQIWKDWFEFYKRHFRGADIRISSADQMAFYEIAQPILRGLTLPVPPGAGERLKLGDIVRANETFPNFHEWRNAEMKIVSMRIDPEGNQWVSVTEGSPRHRRNGAYDSETTDIKADWLSRQAPHSSDGEASDQ